VEYGEPGADLFGEAEEVQFDPELPMIAFCRLLEPGLVGAKFGLGRPCGPVDPLQHGVRLAAAPIRSSAAHERPAISDEPGVRNVGSSAEILPTHLPGLRIDVVVDGEFGSADLNALVVVSGCPTLEANELQLVRLIAELFPRVFLGYDPTHEPLALLDNL